MTSNDSSTEYPRTIETATELVLDRMSSDLKDWLKRFSGDEIELRVQLATGLIPGMNVRAMLGLWGKNPELMALMPHNYQHPDDASNFFLIECWRHLQQESK
jgi:hypothetical protein